MKAKKIYILSILLFVSGLTSAQTINVIGGNDININQAPWQILLEINGTDACGGSILNDSWIITAAHCICETNANTQNIRVIAGITRRSQKNSGQLRGISEILINPGYNCIMNNSDFDSDIALLRLSSPLSFNNNVQSINFATNIDEINGLLDPGVDASITGWGWVNNIGSRPDNLQMANLPIISNQTSIDLGSQVTANMISLFENGVGAAPGDSGGPMVVPDGGNGFILGGVSSWGFFPKDQNPTIYTRVSNYCNWITENITSITGPSLLCTSNQTFTLNNVPAGATVSWSVSPTSLFAVDNGSGTSFTTRATNATISGSGSVRATINGGCGNVVVSRNTWVGKPKFQDFSINGLSNVNCQTIQIYDYQGMANGSTGFVWESSGHLDNVSYVTGSNVYIDPVHEGNGFLAFKANNSCGSSYFCK